jgi:hypothetical protein
MTSKCWNTVIDFYMNVTSENPDIATEQVVRQYKTAYERALLNSLRNEASNA